MKQPPKPALQVRAGIDVGATELVVALQRDCQCEPLLTLPNTTAGHRQLTRLLTRPGATGSRQMRLRGFGARTIDGTAMLELSGDGSLSASISEPRMNLTVSLALNLRAWKPKDE